MNRHRFLLSIFIGLALVCPPAPAETLTGQGVSVEISVSDNRTLGTLSGLPVDEANVFAITGPIRLVIDLPGAHIKKNESFKANTGLVKGVRFGTYPDKTRVVFDLTSAASAPVVKSQVVDGRLLIELSESGSSAPRQVPTELPTLAPSQRPVAPTAPQATPTSEPTPTAIPSRTSSPTRAPTAVPSLPPTETPANYPTSPPTLAPTAPPPEATAAPTNTRKSFPIGLSVPPEELTKPLPGGPITVERLEFDYFPEDRSPVLKIVLNQRTEYKLSRTDQKIFRLIIPGSHLAGKFLTLPQFPPGDFVGLDSVQAKPLKDDVEILINVDLGARLASFAKENEIWVRVLNK